jgi:hypothetical protein
MMIDGSRRWATTLIVASFAVFSGCQGRDAPAALPDTLQQVAFDTLFQIGSDQGETWQAFGGIWDVDVSPSGNIAVLDIETGQVHVYDAEGAHLGSVVESGLDEGALEGPAGLAWRGADDLLVWDPGSSWISRFRVGRSGVEFVDRSRGFAFGETGFCAHDDRTYLSYWQDGLVVHELGPDGPVRSFGAAPQIPGMSTLGPELQEIATEELSPSGLLCTPNGVLDVAYFGSRFRFHNPDGTPRWEKDFADFNPLVVYTPDGMGLGRRFDAAAGTHLLKSVVAWGDEFALVQHELRTREFPEEGEVVQIESRLIRLSDGEEVDRTRDLPVVLATWGARLYLVETQPYPKIVVVESTGGG